MPEVRLRKEEIDRRPVVSELDVRCKAESCRRYLKRSFMSLECVKKQWHCRVHGNWKWARSQQSMRIVPPGYWVTVPLSRERRTSTMALHPTKGIKDRHKTFGPSALERLVASVDVHQESANDEDHGRCSARAPK